MEKKPAVLLLFLSDYKSKNQEKIYTVEGIGATYPGVQTNDAPVRYLYDSAAAKGNPIRKVLCITSYKVLADKDQNGEPKSIANLKTVLKDAADQKRYAAPKLLQIPYDISGKGKKLGKAEAQKSICTHLMSVLGDLQKGTDSEEGCEVYIDYTGGLRDIAFLMTSVIKFLEFTGSSCSKIVYSELDGKIYSLNHIYGLYQLINGVQEFVDSGKATELVRYFEKEDQGQREIIENMLNFSDAISLCDSDRIQESIVQLNAGITSFEKQEHKGFNSVLLAALLPYVRKKLFLDEEGRISYEQLIEWCRKNRYIQQAATLYIEKIPQMFFETKDMETVFDRWEKKYQISFKEVKEHLRNTVPSKVFYDFFYDAFIHEKDIETFKNICDKLGEIAKNEKQKKLKRKAVLDEIKTRTNTENKAISTGLGRLEKIIFDYFDPEGKKVSGNPVVNGEEQKQKDLVAFFNSITNENCKLAFLITGENNRSKDSTYTKKTRVLDKLKRFPVDVETKALRNVLGYYLAFKIVRNRLNHAADENEQKQDEISAITYLEEEGFLEKQTSVKATEKLEAVSRLIDNGIAANRELRKILACQTI